MSIEIAQLCKSAYNNQLQQAIYLCHQKKRCLKYGRCIQFGRAKKVKPRCTRTPPNRVRNKQKSASPQPTEIPSGQKD